MAIVKFGGIVTGLRGSVGGSTFRGYRGRSIMYNKQTTRTGRGTINGGNPNNFPKYASLWRSLIVENRENWGQLSNSFEWYDKNGNAYNPNGWQLFQNIISHRRKFNDMDLTTDGYTQVIDGGNIIRPDVFLNGTMLNNVSSVGLTNQVIVSMRLAGSQNDNNPEVQTKEVDALTLSTPDQYVTNYRANGFDRNLRVGDIVTVKYNYVNDFGYSQFGHIWTSIVKP